jgi:hypothetical protein
MFALRVNSGTRLTKKGPQKGDLCIGIWAAIAALFVVAVNRRDRLAGNPSKLTGPSWVEHEDAERGYLDRYFTGWLDLRNLKMPDYAALARLLIAYIDDAGAVDDKEALKILKLHAN